MNKEELLYNEIYERTKDFGRTQFVRELMRLQRENKELQQKVNQLETNIDEAIEYVNKYFEKEYKKPREELKKYNLKNCTYDSGLVVLGILERGKE